MATKTKSKYESKGQRPNVSKKNIAKRSETDKIIGKFDAFRKGRDVMFTIDNPNPKETNKRKIRVSGKVLYGDFRKYR